MPSASDPSSAPSRPEFPERLGAYELLLPIASGGMGTVYLARKRGAGGFEREVALKLTHAFLREQPEWKAEIIEEAKLASRIHHPNVVQVLDVEDDPSGVFLVMQYVEGDTLGALMQDAVRRGARIPPDVALRILFDALSGLHAAHELRGEDGQPLGLVHRDFTPQNILVGLDGASRLTDFGVAKAASRAGATRTGIVKGKTAYMAPEQVRAQPLDRRADIWAAGILAWEILAGRRMYAGGEDPTAILFKIVSEEPPLLGTVRSDVPPALEAAIASALTMDRVRRTPTAERFREALVRACEGWAAPAEPKAVGAYVGVAAEAKLAERRARIVELRSGRAREGAVVPVTEATDVSLVTTAARESVRRPRGVFLLGAGALVLAASGGAFFLRGRAHGAPAATSLSAPPTPTPSAGLPGSPASVEPLAPVESAAPTALPVTAVAASSPPVTPPAQHRRRVARPGPSATPPPSASAGTPLAKSPYE